MKALIAGSRSQVALRAALALLRVAVAPGAAQAGASEARLVAS
jgi:hypothetical protein